jgi:hypothetical protein
VDNAGEQEEEGSSHQRKKAYQNEKKHLRKHPKHESNENREKKKETT